MTRATYASCSWCHELNPVGERWCASCGHAAHRPRLACDCGRCRRELPVDLHRWAADWREGWRDADTEAFT